MTRIRGTKRKMFAYNTSARAEKMLRVAILYNKHVALHIAHFRDCDAAGQQLNAIQWEEERWQSQTISHFMRNHVS